MRALGAYFAAGRLFLRESSVRRLAIAPLLINVVLFAVGLPLIAWWTIGQVSDLVPASSAWGEAGVVVLQILAGFLVIAGGAVLFTLVGTVIASPFLGPLAERVERFERSRLGLPPEVLPEGSAISGALRGILFSLGRLVLFLALYPLIFLLQFVPVIGSIAHPLLAFLYASFVFSVDFSDPVLDRRLGTFREKIRFVWVRPHHYLPFGALSVLILMIPLLNLVVIPLATAAATSLYVSISAAEPRA